MSVEQLLRIWMLCQERERRGSRVCAFGWWEGGALIRQRYALPTAAHGPARVRPRCGDVSAPLCRPSVSALELILADRHHASATAPDLSSVLLLQRWREIARLTAGVGD